MFQLSAYEPTAAHTTLGWIGLVATDSTPSSFQSAKLVESSSGIQVRAATFQR